MYAEKYSFDHVFFTGGHFGKYAQLMGYL